MEFCHTTAKLFLELERPRESAWIWEQLLEQDDNIAELHYHLGLAYRHFSSSLALEALQKARKLLQQVGCQDQELQQQVEELTAEVQKENIELEDDEEGEDSEDDNDDMET